MKLVIAFIACMLCSCGRNQDSATAERAAGQELALLVRQAKMLNWRVSDLPEVREKQIQDRRILGQHFDKWYADRPEHPQARICLEVGGAVKSSIPIIEKGTSPVSIRIMDGVLARRHAEIVDMLAILTAPK